MHTDSITILEKYKNHWHTLRDAGYVAHIDHATKKELEAVYQKEIDPRYHLTAWCGECVSDMIKRLYQTYETQHPFIFPDDLDKIQPKELTAEDFIPVIIDVDYNVIRVDNPAEKPKRPRITKPK